MNNCKFLVKDVYCSIGCLSLGIRQNSACFYTRHTELDSATCPCHSEGLTFILADRVKKVLQDLQEEADREDIECYGE